MHLTTIATHVDLFASATILGSTVWFFFVQSPVMLRRAGREAFVPMQMRLTVVLFKTLQALLLVSAGASILAHPLLSSVVLSAAAALAAGVINTRCIVPRALKAGGQTRRDIKGKDDEASTLGFASDGAGAKTKFLHRVVVLFVVIMLAGTGVHLVTLICA